MDTEFNMEKKREKRNKIKKSKKIIFISIIAFVILGIIISLFVVSATYNKTFKNITVCDVNVGELDEKDVLSVLNKSFELYSPVIQINCNGTSRSLNFDSIAEFDINKTAENAISFGKENIFTKFWYYYFGKQDLPLEIIINQAELEDELTEFQSNLENPYLDTSYKIDDDILVVKAGASGNSIDIPNVSKEIVSLIKNGKDVVLDVVSTPKNYTGININDLYNKVYREPKNAYYDEKTSKIVPHVVGYTFDVAKAEETVKNAQEGEEFKIQLSVTYPDVTEDTLTGKMFADTLATYSTRYNPGEVNRTHNMYLASSKVNGTVLAPGEVFSYNKVVGERTVAKGYRNAKIFENGRVVDGLAGGICQVSTTIYNAALYSDLKIVERKNHSFPVAYAPMGQDATVVMGAIDFKFSNSTDAPIKIVSSVSGGLCTVSILGTDKNHYKVTIQNTITSTRPRPTVYENDITLEKGIEKVKQEGSDGYTVKSKRIVSKNGEIIKSENIPSSYYIPLEKIVLRNEETEETPNQEPIDENNEPEVITPSQNPEVIAPSQNPEETPEPEVSPEVSPENVPSTPDDEDKPVTLPADSSSPLPTVPVENITPEADENTGV